MISNSSVRGGKSRSKKEDMRTSSQKDFPVKSHGHDNIDPEIKQKVKQVIDAVQCTQDDAILALHDCDNDVNSAVNLLLDPGNNMQDGWQEQSNKKHKRKTAIDENEPPLNIGEPEERDITTEQFSHRSTERRGIARNQPPRMQRGRGARRPNFPPREDGEDEQPFEDGAPRREQGDRGRGRARGRGRGFGGPRNGFGFGRRAENSEPVDARGDKAPQIGTWTSEADANPSTDSWVEVWGEEDNQWQGDLKGTHVFEASAVQKDIFSASAEFDPTAVATQSSLSTDRPGGVDGQRLQDVDIFSKVGVESIVIESRVSTTNSYDNQHASDTIKNAIGILNHQSNDSKTPPANLSTLPAQQQMPQMASQPKRPTAVKPPRTKLPPPSTKIPTAPVEMPLSASTSVMDKLGVQFGSMDFTSDAALTFDSSPLADNYKSLSSASGAVGAPRVSQPSSNSMFTSSASSVQAADSIPYPSTIQSTVSQQQASQANSSSRSQNAYSSHPKTTASSQYSYSGSTPASTSSAGYKQSSNGPLTQQSSTQSFQRQQPMSSYAGYTSQSADSYQHAQATANYQSGNLYSNDTAYHQYSNAAASLSSSTASTVSSLSSGGISALSSAAQSQSSLSSSSARPTVTSKLPPNLPPPAAPPVAQMPQNFLVSAQTMPYYSPQQTYYSLDEMQKYPHYYDLNSYQMAANSLGTNAIPYSGSVDGKHNRLDAQSPTMQGSQSQPGTTQLQQTSQQQQSHQQYMSPMTVPYGTFFYPPNLVPSHYPMYQMPSVTQNMAMPGTNSTGAYPKPGGNYLSYAGYDELATHPADYSKSVYGGGSQLGKQTNSSGSGTDLTSMYKPTGSQTAAAQLSGNTYNPSGGYIHSAHMMSHPQLMQQQMGAAQDAGVGRSSQSASVGKSHSAKQANFAGYAWGT